MTLREMLIKAITDTGADGLVHPSCECGCGDKVGWFMCEGVNLDECKLANWRSCQDCDKNGNCDRQEYWGIEATNPDEGCYFPMEDDK